MNKTNGGFEPWTQSPKKDGQTRSFSPMKQLPDFEYSDENDIPREIARDNFGSTFTKFGQPNTVDRNEKSNSRSTLQSPVLMQN